MLENRSAQHGEVVDKYVNPTSSYQMKTYDYVVRPSGASAAVTITLPSVSEAKGRIYTIMAKDVTNAITVQDKDDSEDWDGDFTLDTLNDKLCLYSDGLSWFVLTNGIA